MAKKKQKELPEERDLQSLVSGLEEYGITPAKRWFLPTGSRALDYIISLRVDGTGGYPGGCIVELFGEPSTGKSLLLAKAAAEAQKLEILPIIADAEARWDDEFARVHGVDETKRRLFIPGTVEEFATGAFKQLSFAKEHGYRVILILDSLAILATLKETEDIEEGELKMDQGRKAQRIRQSMRVLKSLISETGSIMLIANHVIANPGSYSGKTTPGGGGVPFQSSVRIELLSTEKILLKGKKMPIGVKLHAKIAKNSIAPPFGDCIIDVNWATGADPYSGLVPIMEDLGIVTRNGAWYSYGDVKFQSTNLDETIAKHPGILADPRWTKPYFLGGEYEVRSESDKSV